MSGSTKLLIAGFVLVIALVVGLFKFLGGTSDPATASPSRPAPTTGNGNREEAKAEPTKPDVKAESSGGAVTSARPRPAIADNFVSNLRADEPVDRDADGLVIPIINKPDIGIANVTTDNKMRECIVKHGFTRSGTAVLTFIVAKKKDERGDVKITVEDSGYEDEGLTIDDPAVVECLHKTAFEMQFQPPKNVRGVPVWGKRKVRIEDGMLRENSIVNIGRIR